MQPQPICKRLIAFLRKESSAMLTVQRSMRKIVFLLLCCMGLSQAKTIIWDLGETLFSTSHFAFARTIGLQHFLSYMLFDWKNPNIKPKVFDILERMNPSEEHPREIATDNEGNPLPIIMHKWLAGIISGAEIIKSMHDYIGQLEMQDYFVSKREKTLVVKTLEQMFNPQALVDATYPITDAIELLHDCYHAKNEDGSPKNTLFILSNWDEVSFELLKKRYTSIFNTYFDLHRIVISGAIGLIKPARDAFLYVLKTYNLDPTDCIFIDDLYDNILAAQSVGITSLMVCKNNYKTLRNILARLGAL